MDATNIRTHMEVVGSCGNHVGTVDAVEGISIRLKRRDADAEGIHHFIPADWVESVGDVVRLNLPAAEAQRQWHFEPFAATI